MDRRTGKRTHIVEVHETKRCNDKDLEFLVRTMVDADLLPSPTDFESADGETVIFIKSPRGMKTRTLGKWRQERTIMIMALVGVLQSHGRTAVRHVLKGQQLPELIEEQRQHLRAA